MTTPSMKKILFDAHAILKWTQKEKGYQKVKSLMIACSQDSAVGYMSQINLGEVYYKTIRAVGTERAKLFLDTFYRLPVTVVPPETELIWKASEIKAEYSISYADCFAASTALKYNATIITGDQEFRKIASIVPIDWI